MGTKSCFPGSSWASPADGMEKINIPFLKKYCFYAQPLLYFIKLPLSQTTYFILFSPSFLLRMGCERVAWWTPVASQDQPTPSCKWELLGSRYPLREAPVRSILHYTCIITIWKIQNCTTKDSVWKNLGEDIDNEENRLWKCRHFDHLELWHRKTISQYCPIHIQSTEKKKSVIHKGLEICSWEQGVWNGVEVMGANLMKMSC